MRKTLFYVAVGLLLMSCNKNEPQSNPVNNAITDFDQLNVRDDFNWSTSHTVDLNLQKVPGAQPNLNMLVVRDAEGNVLFRSRVSMAVDGTVQFSAPKALTEVEVEYGITKKAVAINGKQANFDFLPVLDNSDLD